MVAPRNGMVNSNYRNLATSDYLTKQRFDSNTIRKQKIFMAKHFFELLARKTLNKRSQLQTQYFLRLSLEHNDMLIPK